MASSLKELEAEIRAEMMAAAQDAAAKMFDDLQGEVLGYYTGTPRQYTRTFQLTTTPTLDPISGGGNTVSFRVWLNGAGGYTTGSYPSMATVIGWTDNGQAGTIGHHGYWNRSLAKMKGSLISAFNSHFS